LYTPLGHYEIKALSFGLIIVTATFQVVLIGIFRQHGKFVLVYLNDILVFSKSVDEHAEHLQLELHGLYTYEHELQAKHAKHAKCTFNQLELELLHRAVGSEGRLVPGRKVGPIKTAVVRDWADLRMRPFLGLTKYFCGFVQGYAKLVGSLIVLLRGTPKAWSAYCQAAFDGVTLSLTIAPCSGHV